MNEAISRWCARSVIVAVVVAGYGCTSSSSEHWAQTGPVIKADVVNLEEPVTLGMRGERRSFDQSP